MEKNRYNWNRWMLPSQMGDATFERWKFFRDLLGFPRERKLRNLPFRAIDSLERVDQLVDHGFVVQWE